MANLNINSEAVCRKAYLNYHLYGNTMNVSNEQMGEIIQKWKSHIKNWQASVSNDETVYLFDDTRFENIKDKSRENTKNNIGYTNGDKAGDIINTGFSAGLSVAGVVTQVAGEKIAEKIAEKAAVEVTGSIAAEAGEEIAEGVGEVAAKKGAEEASKAVGGKTTAEAAEKVGEEAGTKAGEEAAKNIDVVAIIAAGIAIANAAKYWITKPNKEGKEACDELYNEMGNASAALSQQQAELASNGEMIASLSDEATEINTEANASIASAKTEQDMYMASINALKVKAQSEGLSPTEEEMYANLASLVDETGQTIASTSEEATTTVQAVNSDMNTYQEGFDYAAETMAEVQGITDYAESFDKSTRTLCYVEAGAQGLNALSGVKAGMKLFAGPWWQWIIGAASLAAGASSGVAAGQQIKYAGDIGNEIEARKMTQDLNVDTNEIYIEEVDNFSASLMNVESLELEVPEAVSTEELVLNENTTQNKEKVDKEEEKLKKDDENKKQ